MYNFTKKQKIIVGIILAIMSIVLINYVYLRKPQTISDEDLNIYEEEDIQEEEIKQEEDKKEIVVHVAGAINVEGIVFLKEGDRVSSAIEKAGGVTQDADMSQVNLAYQLEDGMKIYIPKIGEYKQELQENVTIPNQVTNEKKTTKVNINTATKEELETLPGIGKSTAEKIIKYRQENKRFSKIDEIKEVSGIGDAKFNSIKDLITT